MSRYLEPLCDPPDRVILAERAVGRFRVQVYVSEPGVMTPAEPVYRVLAQENGDPDKPWRKVRCFTRAECRAFPKTAAAVGSEMVHDTYEAGA